MAKDNGKPIYAAPAPGRVRGEWDPDATYVRDDLVCVRHPDGDGTTSDFWYISVKRSTGVHPENGGDAWERSPWINITEEFTQPGYRYQRVHSIHPEMIDEYMLGRGVPAWYYFDMLGFFDTRTKLASVIDLLITMRGTILGAQAFLNLVNLESSFRRLAPEEKYEFDETPDVESEKYLKDLSREIEWRKEYMAGLKYWDIDKTDCSNDIKLARTWNSCTSYDVGDLVFHEDYDESEKYIGCSLYKALTTFHYEEGGADAPRPRRGSPDWEWICGYAIKPMEKFNIPAKTDNSLYELMITQLAGRDASSVEGRILITDAEAQQIYTCHYARLIEFLIPAWIRIESGIRLLDTITVDGARHASTFNILTKPEFEGIEPHTLTVLPYIGEMGEVASVTNIVGVDESGVEFDMLEAVNGLQWGLMAPYGGAWVPAAALDVMITHGDIPGYYWREPYMPEQYDDAWTLKVKVPAFQRVRLRSTVENGSYYFWRWSLLNSYHWLPHFRVAGRSSERRWIDLEPTLWSRWESTAWEDVSGGSSRAAYSSCTEED